MALLDGLELNGGRLTKSQTGALKLMQTDYICSNLFMASTQAVLTIFGVWGSLTQANKNGWLHSFTLS